VISRIPANAAALAAACCMLVACGQGSGSQQQKPQSADAVSATQLRIAAAAEKGGDSNLAAAMYGKVGSESSSDYKLQLKVAEGLARNGKFPEAEQALKDGLKSNPGQPDLLRALALINIILGQPEQAVVELDRVIAVRPKDSAALVNKAIALDLMKMHGDAQVLYRKALELSPGDLEISNDLAVSMMLEGRLKEAEAVLAPLQYTEAYSSRMKNNLGVIYAASGARAKAEHAVADGVSMATIETIAQALPKAVEPAATAR
jgi:Flp pilus assembly protein TadD